MKKHGVMTALAVGMVVLALAGCSGGRSKSDIGVVDMSRIMANWPKFENYNNQIQADAFAIETSKEPESEKIK